jgi:enamine deaminase RidA (YjgF/YER057c/UK114 family)
MVAKIESRLRERGIEFPPAAKSLANYVPFVQAGRLLTVSGQLCFDSMGALVAKGKLGDDVSIEQGQLAARLCALNVLSQANAALGDLERIVRVIRLGGFINATPDFLHVAAVMNGASDVIGEILEERGRHARSTVGVATLPMGAAVEVEATFEVG